MDWRRNIVRCLMLATLVVAACAPVNAARPGLFGAGRGGGGSRTRTPHVNRSPGQNNGANTGGALRGGGDYRLPTRDVFQPPVHNHGANTGGAWRGGGDYRLPTPDVFRPPVQNNVANTGGALRGGGDYRLRTRDVFHPPVQNNGANTGGLGRVPGHGSASPGNAEYMRAVEKNNNQQIHPDLGYDIYSHRSKPGRSNMGTIGSSTSDTVYGKSVRNAASNAIEKPGTAAAFSKNKYQKSSNTIDHDRIIRTIKKLRKLLNIPEAEKEVDRSYPNSDQDESTAMKITNVNAGDGKKPWVMVTTPDRTWYFEIEGTWYVVRFIGSTAYLKTIRSTNSSHISNEEEGIRTKEIMRLVMEDLQ